MPMLIGAQSADLPRHVLVKLVREWAATFTTALAFLTPLVGTTQWRADAALFFVRIFLLSIPLLALATLCSMVMLRPWLRRWPIDVGHVVGAATFVIGIAAGAWSLQFIAVGSVPRTRRAVEAVAILVAAAFVIAIAAGFVARRSRFLSERGAFRVGAIASMVLAALGYLFERNGRFVLHWPFRMSHSLVELSLLLFAAYACRRLRWTGRNWAIAGSVLFLLAVACAAALPARTARRVYAAVSRKGGGSEQRLLAFFRAATDRDRDGYSAHFAGGDCDDSNPRAYPLGPIDCDGIMPSTPPVAATGAVLPPIARVDKILVVTIDSWRCVLDGEPLCADLYRAAADASYVGTEHVFMAQTVRSLGALFGAPYVRLRVEADEQPNYVVTRARSAGYRTTAFYTLPEVEVPAVIAGFDQRDTTLKPTAPGRSPHEEITAGRLTARVVDALHGYLGLEPRSFVWVHYLDPHDVYLSGEEGAPPPWLHFDRSADYSAEVRRTQAHVAKLVENARALGFGANAAIVVTGDHGETLTKGRDGHGGSSAGREIDVPFIAWLFDADGRICPLPLPKTIYQSDAAAVLAAIVGAPPPTGQSHVSVTRLHDDFDEQFAVVDEGWKLTYHREARYEELFHVADDPDERFDLADVDAGQLSRMRRVLGEQLAAAPMALRVLPLAR